MSTSQSKLESLYETLINIAIGFWISAAVGHFVFPWFGMKVSAAQNLNITLIFTVTSIIRSYTIRRFFNARIHKLAQRMAQQ